MTSHRERVEACIQGQIIDRPPVALWRHFPVDDQQPESLAEAHLAFQSTHDFDLVKVTPASSFSVLNWGVEDEWLGNIEGTRTYSKRVIHQPSDWLGLPVLQPSAPALARQIACIRLLRRRLGPGIPILQTVFNPLSQAKHLAGDETLMQHLRSEPDAIRAGLRTITASTRLFVQAVEAAGADGIFYAVQHAQAHLMSRSEFEQLSHQDDMALLESAGGMWCNMLHAHGEGIHFDAFRDYPAQIINWHDREAGPSLDEAGERWPRALCGGIARQTLTLGSPDDVKREAIESMTGRFRGRLLLSTGCVVPIIAPRGNLRAAANAATLASGASQDSGA